MNNHLNLDLQLGEALSPKVAIVRALPGLGDMLCFVPALRALRAAFPDAQITLIGLKAVSSFVERFNQYLDRLLEFPGFPGIPEVPFSPQHTVSFLANAQQLDFDLVLQMHGSGASINSFLMLLGAKVSAGFFPQGHHCPDPDRFLLYPEQEPEVWRHLRLLEFLGIPLQGDQLEFPLQQSDWQEWKAIASIHELNQGYVCLHPGASVSLRRWPYQYFAAVADMLVAQGFQIVLTGTAAERELTQAVAQAMQSPAVNLAGQTSLGAIAVLLKHARLLICNDTGISHLAAALQVTSVVIFTGSDPQRWAPLDRQRHRVVNGYSTSEQPTANPFHFADTLPTPTVTSVLAEAEALLQQEVAYAS